MAEKEKSKYGPEPHTISLVQNSCQSTFRMECVILEKLKLNVTDKPFTPDNAEVLFVEAVHAAGTSYTLDYNKTDKDEHGFNLIVDNLVLGTGKSLVIGDARTEAYCHALKRLNEENVSHLIGKNTLSDETKKHSNPTDVERDDTRPLSTLVIVETQRTAVKREKMAMSILRNSVYYSRMNLDRESSIVGDVHKATVSVQNKPIGIGLGPSLTKASMSAAGDALFNHFYRKNKVIQSLTLDEEDPTRWVAWDKIMVLAREMETIGGHSLVSGEDVSKSSLTTAIQKLVDTHPWSEVNDELIFGPGMSDECVQILISIAKDRNLSFEGRRDSEKAAYYIIQRFYDPLDIVAVLERYGGSKGKYRLIPNGEISQTQCHHWNPSPEIWEPDVIYHSKRGPRKVHTKRHPALPRIHFDFVKLPNDGKEFAGISKSEKKKKYILSPQSVDKSSLPKKKAKNRRPRNREKSGFNKGEFGQRSKSDNEFRPMSDSCYREPNQMSWPNDRGYGQMPNDRGYGQMPNPNDRGYGQMPNDRGYGQMSNPNDRGYGQMSNPNDRGYGQMPNPNDSGYEQMPNPNDRVYGQMPNDRRYGQMSNPNDRGYGQMPNPNDRGYGQMSNPNDRGYGQMPNPNDRGYGQMPNPSDRGYGQMSNPSDTGYGQMSNPNNSGYGQMSNPNNSGYGQMSNPNNSGNGQMSNPNDRGFEQMPQSDYGGYEQMR